MLCIAVDSRLCLVILERRYRFGDNDIDEHGFCLVYLSGISFLETFFSGDGEIIDVYIICVSPIDIIDDFIGQSGISIWHRN